MRTLLGTGVLLGILALILGGYFWNSADATQLAFSPACECDNVLNWERISYTGSATLLNLTNQINPVFTTNGNCYIITDLTVSSNWADFVGTPCACQSFVVVFDRHDSTGTFLTALTSISLTANSPTVTVDLTTGYVLNPTDQLNVSIFGGPPGFTAVDISVSGMQATP